MLIKNDIGVKRTSFTPSDFFVSEIEFLLFLSINYYTFYICTPFEDIFGTCTIVNITI